MVLQVGGVGFERFIPVVRGPWPVARGLCFRGTSA